MGETQKQQSRTYNQALNVQRPAFRKHRKQGTKAVKIPDFIKSVRECQTHENNSLYKLNVLNYNSVQTSKAKQKERRLRIYMQEPLFVSDIKRSTTVKERERNAYTG